MRLSTIRTAQGTRAVRIDGADAIETGHPDAHVNLLCTWHDAVPGSAKPVAQELEVP